MRDQILRRLPRVFNSGLLRELKLGVNDGEGLLGIRELGLHWVLFERAECGDALRRRQLIDRLAEVRRVWWQEVALEFSLRRRLFHGLFGGEGRLIYIERRLRTLTRKPPLRRRNSGERGLERFGPALDRRGKTARVARAGPSHGLHCA